ncbi:MAG: methylated-DNA--[protein]-cysteine S-methyltransferase [Acidobacteriota bacterium]
MTYRLLDSPVGRLLLAADDRALRVLAFAGGVRAPAPEASWVEGTTDVLAAAADELSAYFRGALTRFTVPVDARGTAFQRAVWRGLVDIPYGDTVSYSELARRIGRPAAVRAVGLANGSNPISIIVPCHRVIGRDGTLTGYGGGLAIKQALLDLERGQRRLV